MRTALSVTTVLLILLSAFAFTPRELPETIEGYQPASEQVHLNFKLSKASKSGVELALDERGIGTFYMQFDVARGGGRPTLVLTGVSDNSRIEGRVSRENVPDHAFLKGRNGRAVLDFSFRQQLFEDAGGNQMMRISYTGAPVPFVQNLEIKESVTLPKDVSQRFGVKGQLRFDSSKLELNREHNGFLIPAGEEGGR